ncbi:alpha/beta hydrolase [Verticiella sediminum]|uniref:Alpha/beta hydrolase n=2 Tax=Verticiella sediminum TaxID=1247510 RepID=A0A556B0G9_9BURK|nr:alpha/beta hydrolase [Verticiella sediminum]
MRRRLAALLATPCLLLAAHAGFASETASAQANATLAQTTLVQRGDVQIEVHADGAGPTLLLLPSRGRGAEDFDVLVPGFVEAGYRVLRPEPRGIGRSRGPMDGITLHDYAEDVAAVLRHFDAAPAVIVGHAFGNWVARTTGVDHPDLVRGVVIVAAAAKNYPDGMAEHVARSADLSLPDDERLKSIQYAFFTPDFDASVWLHGWYPEVSRAQRKAGLATSQETWWSGGSAPLFDLQAGNDPFKPAASRNEVRDEFGERVTLAVIPDTGHALIPQAPQAVVDAIVAWERSLPDAEAVRARQE